MSKTVYMSFSLTRKQMIDGTKGVTRRLGWLNLQPGDIIIPVEKKMGLKKGEKIKPLPCKPRKVKSIRREKLRAMLDDLEYGFKECEREGFGDHPSYKWPSEFVRFFCSTHKKCTPETEISRIELEDADGEFSNEVHGLQPELIGRKRENSGLDYP